MRPRILPFILAISMLVSGMGMACTVNTAQALAACSDEYVLENTLETAFGRVLRYRRFFDGYPVYGDMRIVSEDRAGNLLSDTGEGAPLVWDRPALTKEEISSRAAAVYADAFVAPTPFVIPAGGRARLFYEGVSAAESCSFFISASDGEISQCAPLESAFVATMPQTDLLGNAVDIEVEYDEEKELYLLEDRVRNIFVGDAHHSESEYTTPSTLTSQDGVFEDMAVSAYVNTVNAYDFYTKKENIGVERFGIRGTNDDVAGNWEQRRTQEVPIYVLIRSGNNNENANFAYTGGDYPVGRMLIGEGNPDKVLYRIAAAQDILAHEYQHGLDKEIAKFRYLNESGALDEAFADIFGALVEDSALDDDDFWGMGEVAMVRGGYARSMKDETPGYRYTVADMVPACYLDHSHLGGCDYGGVHYNSTVVTHLQYEIWKAMPDYFTKGRIGTLWYTTLCMLNENATFDDFALAFLTSAVNLGYSDEAVALMREKIYESGILVKGDAQDDVKLYRYLDGSGIEIRRLAMRAGSRPQPPAVPATYETDTAVYTFAGWTSRTEGGFIVCTAYYEETPKEPAQPAPPSEQLFHIIYISRGETVREADLPKGAAHEDPESSVWVRFAGWYCDEACTQVAAPVVTADATLYAKWELDPLPVSLIAVGGALTCTLIALIVLMLRKRFTSLNSSRKSD